MTVISLVKAKSSGCYDYRSCRSHTRKLPSFTISVNKTMYCE